MVFQQKLITRVKSLRTIRPTTVAMITTLIVPPTMEADGRGSTAEVLFRMELDNNDLLTASSFFMLSIFVSNSASFLIMTRFFILAQGHLHSTKDEVKRINLQVNAMRCFNDSVHMTIKYLNLDMIHVCVSMV